MVSIAFNDGVQVTAVFTELVAVFSFSSNFIISARIKSFSKVSLVPITTGSSSSALPSNDFPNICRKADNNDLSFMIQMDRMAEMYSEVGMGFFVFDFETVDGPGTIEV